MPEHDGGPAPGGQGRAPFGRCTGDLGLRGLGGGESFKDVALYGEAKRDWLSRHLALAGGVPSHDTVRRVLMLIELAQFEGAFLAWTRQAFCGTDSDEPMQIAVDGKTVRRSFDRGRGQGPLHLVGAFATQGGLILGQRRVPREKGRGGEMGTLPDLLGGLNLRGALVSLDAGACHPRAAKAITARGGDYLIALKGNCPGLHGAARDWFAASAFTARGGPGRCTDDIEERHGGLTRCRTFVADIEVLIDPCPEAIAAWPGLRHMVAVEAIRIVEHPPPGAERKVGTLVRCFLTSSDAPTEKIATGARAHWAIENGLSYMLDTVFGEDLSRVHDQNAAANLAVLRRSALHLVRADPSSGSLKAKRKRAA